ncbi:MAG: lysophospholipase [Pseudonocardia sp.]|nr:lysophospholipase [Pseudonocardia sp.]
MLPSTDVRTRIDGHDLVVELTRAQRVAGLLRDVRVPLHAVRDVEVVPNTLYATTGIRAPGLGVPGLIKIGTWRRRGHRELVVAGAGAPGVRVSLSGRPYDALVLATDEPERLAADLRSAAAPSEELTFSSAGHRLVGTLLRPERPGLLPAALLLPGSGPLDRDSSHPRMPLDVTRHLAEALADAGIPSLRYDKRGVGASAGNFHRTGFTDNTDDAAAALAALAAQPGIDPDRIVVVGHSEGALHATVLAGGGAGTVPAAAVLLAGAAHTGEDVLRYQVRAIAPLLPAPVRALLTVLRADLAGKQEKRFAKLRATTTDTTGHGPLRVNARWWREFLAFDPRPLLAATQVPVLAITGARDVQVDPADAAAIARLVTDAPAESYVAPGVTHILRRTEDAGGPSTYRRQARRPLDADVVARVVGFVREQTS